ncbi:MAG TPA: transglutaminase-like cysteine peptidase [Sphingobium sp.]
MTQGESADAPDGFKAMCLRDALLCTVGQSARPLPAMAASMGKDGLSGATGTARVGGNTHLARTASGAPPFSRSVAAAYRPISAHALLGDEQLATAIKLVNKQVNHGVTQVTDSDALGIDEYWSRLPPGANPVGDCEDIAIEKRIRLTEAGFPTDRLFYGVAYLRAKGLHTVLIARLSDGDYVLDSMTPHILNWQQTSYLWLRQQTPGNPMQWTRVAPKGTTMRYADKAAPADVATGPAVDPAA